MNLALALVLVVGGVLRFATVARSLETNAQRSYSDGLLYLLGADALREGAGPLTIAVFVRGPVYPVFVFLVGGGQQQSDAPILYAQAALGVLTILLVYLLGCMAVDRPTGLVGAAIAALWPLLVDLPAMILTEPVRAFLVVLVVLALVWYRQQPSVVRAVGAGTAVSLLAVSHSSAFLLPVPLLGWALLISPRWKLAPVLVAPILLTAMLWTVLSLALFGRVIQPGQGGLGVGGGGGWTAYVGSRPTTGGLVTPPDYDLVEPVRYDAVRSRAALGDPALEPEIASYVLEHDIDAHHPIPDRVFWQAYIGNARRDPVGFATVAAWKASTLVTDHGLVIRREASFFGEWPTISRVVYSLALLGLAWPIRRFDLWSRLLLLIVPSYILGLAGLTYAEWRYWWPVLPLVALLAAVPITSVARMRLPQGPTSMREGLRV